MNATCLTAPTHDVATDSAPFLEDVLNGLQHLPKRVPSKYFYDQTGSELFDQICELPEYYVTRTELEIMEQHAAEMAEWVGPSPVVIEFGSGSSLKTRLLLDHLDCSGTYMPIDVSHSHLMKSAASISQEYPALEVVPVTGDFTSPIEISEDSADFRRRTVYFPGSTIGNFTPDQARDLIDHTAELVGLEGGLLIGFDLKKDPAVLTAAYNDAAGVTARFNLNLLCRINRELGGNFNPHRFHHQAIWNEALGRMEMHLISAEEQCVHIDEEWICFATGESICTEYSHKYDIEEMCQFLAKSGFHKKQLWTDADQKFAVGYFECELGSPEAE